MAVDFNVIFAVRQRFGGDPADDFPPEAELETDAPFVGSEKSFVFDCPSVNRSQFAVLCFQAQGVSPKADMFVNEDRVRGAIPQSNVVLDSSAAEGGRREVALWIGNVFLVHPNVLKEQGNVLRIAAGHSGDRIDNFVLDNCVVFFKTRAFGSTTGGLTPSEVTILRRLAATSHPKSRSSAVVRRKPKKSRRSRKSK